MAKEETKTDLLFWLDMEMSGLDPETCAILEIAAVITDLDLNKIDEFQAVVYQPPEILKAMDDWCTSTHGASGLTQEVSRGQPIESVEKDLVSFTEKHFPKGKVILAGNSIWQDRRFVEAYLLKFSKLLHYRMVDVSAFKEIYKNKYKIHFKKTDTHRAKTDIYESIGELAHYIKFINPRLEEGPISS